MDALEQGRLPGQDAGRHLFPLRQGPEGLRRTDSFANAEEASQFLIHEQSVICVPWDNAGAYLRFSVTYMAKDETRRGCADGGNGRRLGRLSCGFENVPRDFRCLGFHSIVQKPRNGSPWGLSRSTRKWMTPGNGSTSLPTPTAPGFMATRAGFRTRQYREHIEGDYKIHHQQGKYDAELEHSKKLMTQGAVALNPEWRKIVGAAVREKLTAVGRRYCASA